jgi:membrane protease YdiL (CAAX protease family)
MSRPVFGSDILRGGELWTPVLHSCGHQKPMATCSARASFGWSFRWYNLRQWRIDTEPSHAKPANPLKRRPLGLISQTFMSSMENKNNGKQNKYSVIIFFGMTYAFSWILWIPIALSSQKIVNIPISPFLGIIIGGMGPSLSALILILAEQGTQGIHGLFERLLKWKVAIKWYLFIIVVPVVIIFVALVLYSFLNRITLNIPAIGDWRIVIRTAFITLLIGGPLGEELGWRGYALPKLLEARNPILASLIIGVGWGMWHLPLFWIQGSLQADIPIAWFMISILAEAILYTWIYNNTRGSLLLMVIFHTSINMWADLLLIPVVAYSLLPMILTFSMEVAIALAVLTKLRTGPGIHN